MELIKSIVDIVILIILGGMGFLATLFTIERIMFLKRVKRHFASFSNQDEFENVLTNNITTLYIIYSNAPYVGLLGTVIGIMITFYDMGQAATIDASQIMTGLSLALYATALGLVVAIPTLIAYNALTRKIAVISSEFKNYLANQQEISHAKVVNSSESQSKHSSSTATSSNPSKAPYATESSASSLHSHKDQATHSFSSSQAPYANDNKHASSSKLSERDDDINGDGAAVVA